MTADAVTQDGIASTVLDRPACGNHGRYVVLAGGT